MYGTLYIYIYTCGYKYTDINIYVDTGKAEDRLDILIIRKLECVVILIRVNNCDNMRC